MKKRSEGKTQLQNKIRRTQLDKKLVFMLEESIPKSENARKQYMADISLFYTTIFKEKLEHFISEQLLELAQIGRTEEQTNILRSNINCFRLIDEWMEMKTNEHLGNLNEIRSSFKDDKELIDNFKQIYGEN